MSEDQNYLVEHDAYHADHQHTGNSMLSDGLEYSMLYYWHKYVGHTIPPEQLTSVQIETRKVGTATHLAILQPDEFRRHVKKIPLEVLAADGSKRGNAWKDWEKEQLSANKNALLLKAKAYQGILAMRDAVYANPMAKRLLAAAGPVEEEHRWECRLTGLPRKMKPDKKNRRFLVDAKTTEVQDPNPKAWGKKASDFGYHRQEQFYLDGANDKYGEDLLFAFVVVSKRPPHLSWVHVFPPEVRRLGRDEVDKGLTTLADCKEKDIWPHEGHNRIHVVEYPKWALNSNR